MLYIIIISIIYTGVCICLIICNLLKIVNRNKVNFLTENSLNEYLHSVIKKRKSVNKNIKNEFKSKKKQIKYSYKRIVKKKVILNKSDYILPRKTGHLLWVENNVIENIDNLQNILKTINSKHLKEKFRAVNGKIIIDEIAKSYVFLSLNKKDFDCVKHFKKIANEYKFFKKEIQILPFLVKYYFIIALFDNLTELALMREKIVRFLTCEYKSVKNKNNDEAVYSFSKYNKNFRRARLSFNLSPEKATYNIGVELLRINTQNKAILMWLSVL